MAVPGGGILNQFLLVEHNEDGTLKSSGSLGSKASSNNPSFTGTVTIPMPVNDTDAATKMYVDSQVRATTTNVKDATASTKGVIQLTGSLAGTAASPQIANGAIANSNISPSAAIDQSKISGLFSELSGKINKTGDTSTGEQSAPSFKASGKSGATATPITLAGGTSSGAPTTGTHAQGEIVFDNSGMLWYCTASGTPGTWVPSGGANTEAVNVVVSSGSTMG